MKKGDNNYVDMMSWETGLSDALKTNVDKVNRFCSNTPDLAPQLKNCRKHVALLLQTIKRNWRKTG